MFLQTKVRVVLVEVLDVTEVIVPREPLRHGRGPAGQAEPAPEEFAKGDLVFPSGETLPRCWQDVDYQTNK